METRKRTPIGNEQYFQISLHHQSDFPRLEQKYSKVQVRCEPCPMFNCHGLTFGSRRAFIWDVKEVQKVLHEDGYVQVPGADVLPGDVAVYMTADGDAEHSGVVVSPPDGILKIPRVVSKWGFFKEVIHLATDCPYEWAVINYYRIRSTWNR